ncbi:hypothetical protein BVRB_2g027160 [Beta vulgaris subsp. vulgaris]|nr:hypothetical protein BVRB_2g027160 [Beta vulgaris subsp. vulgaris]
MKMKLSVQSSFLIIFLLIQLLRFIKADDEYEDCSGQFLCGNISISYPFYDVVNRPEHCGYPGFRVNCSGEYGYPEISSVSTSSRRYLLLQMDANLNNISVFQENLWDGPCSKILYNTTLNTTLFNFVHTVENITLYYECSAPSAPIGSLTAFTCSNSNPRNYFLTPSEAHYRNSLLGICNNNTYVPLSQSSIANIRDPLTLQSALRNGFELNWTANYSLCVECRASGGQCGYNTTTDSFTCYCSDRVHGSTCNVNGRVTLKRSTIVILASISGTGICLLIVLIFYFKRKHPLEKRQDVEAFLKSYGSPGPKRYTYTNLKRITNSFKDKLGEGGYGVVYKGILHNDHLVAVKILKKSQGDMKEFINEVANENFCPKISDFGLAKSCTKKDSIISMSEARGTIGYIAPEVFLKNFGGVSHKSDVYSYGMLVLEMVGCRYNADAKVECSADQYFPDWIYKQLEQVEELDHQGITNSEEGSLRRKMVLVSLWCIQTSPSSRPAMTRVVEMLEGTFETLQIPPMPSLASPLRSQQNTSTMSTISINGLLEQ